MNVTGSQQQPKKSTNAGGRDALVLNPAALYVIHAAHENAPSKVSTTFENGLEKAALYLMGIQVLPPYFVHERDLAQLQQWISAGILI